MLKICGVEKVDYTNKAGKRVEGYRFHCMEDDLPEVTGCSVTSEYVPKNEGMMFLCPYSSFEEVLGLPVRFFYNKFGRCVGLEEVKKNG